MKKTRTTLQALALSCWLLWGISTNAQTHLNFEPRNENLFEVLDSVQRVDSIPTAVDSTSVLRDSIPTAVDSTLTVSSDSTSKEKEIWFFDAVQELKKKNDSKNMNKGKPWIEPDSDDNKVTWTEDWEEEIKVQQNEQLNAQSNPQTEAVKKDTRIAVHGMVSLWTNWVAWDAAELCSTNPTIIGLVDVSHNKSWLGFTTVRLDDWKSDPDQPASRVTILNPHLTKKFWKDKEFKVGLEWKYALFDKMPEANGFSPDIIWSYNTKNGFTFEWMYSHKFKKWPDSDAFRLSISKKIDEALKFTAQWWYETGYDKHFYGRLLLDINLWNWLVAQASLTAKNGKLTPTTCIVYSF